MADHPPAPGHGRDRGSPGSLPDVERLAGHWLDSLPDGTAGPDQHRRLLALAGTLRDALATDPFDPARPRQVGRDLVSAGVLRPSAVDATASWAAVA